MALRAVYGRKSAVVAPPATADADHCHLVTSRSELKKAAQEVSIFQHIPQTAVTDWQPA